MSDNDPVDLIFVLTHGHVPFFGTTRKLASDAIKCWYNWKRGEGDLTGCYLAGAGTENPYWEVAVEWRSVVAMYIREHIPSPSEMATAQLADAQQRMANVMEKQSRRLETGDEWKSEDDE